MAELTWGGFFAPLPSNIGYAQTPSKIGLNKKVIGLMKDELGGNIMTDFVALRPKLYSYEKLDGSKEKKCKGIKKCIVKKTLTLSNLAGGGGRNLPEWGTFLNNS